MLCRGNGSWPLCYGCSRRALCAIGSGRVPSYGGSRWVPSLGTNSRVPCYGSRNTVLYTYGSGKVLSFGSNYWASCFGHKSGALSLDEQQGAVLWR